jgi:hypothetical protein
VSMECGECEHDLRGGHDPSCSRIKLPTHCAWMEEDEDRQDGVCKQDDPANRCRVCPRNEPVQ